LEIRTNDAGPSFSASAHVHEAKKHKMRKWICALVALAGLTGAGGVILSAANAHLWPDIQVQRAANLMLFHAVAALALCSLALLAPRRGGWFVSAAAALLSGSLIFACDMTLRAAHGARLFPMAAPLGGSLLILGWIIVTISAAAALGLSPSGTGDENTEK
jgi:uncharacterized membrane protein YgdD (TMEM256/DUF423 family)